MESASIRCKNPGAMWGRVGKKPTDFTPFPEGPHGVSTNAPIPLRWGSTRTIYLSDGLGQNNNIAIFDTWVQGICAQIDLWRTSKNYRDRRFEDAIAIWSGGNNVPSYINYVKQRVPGITEDTVLDDAFWRGPLACGFLKAQAAHEAGKPIPISDAAWEEAQKIVFDGAKKSTKVGTAVATGTVVAGGTVASATNAGMPGWEIALIVAGIVVVVGAVVFVIHKLHKGV